jgi:hypothetical protein
MARWNTANVLQAAGENRQLWQFALRGEAPHLSREETKLPGEALTARLVSKDWQTLYQPRLNIAWLPADKVFIRVVQLPPSDNHEETVSMVDLQMEKLSPLPTAQIVWTFDLMSKNANGTQTAIVVVAARHHVEDFLGKLETAGYLADRLEVPFIDQLLSSRAEADGVWVFPGTGAESDLCMVAWWCNRMLQNVTLLHLPAEEERGVFVREQIAQMAWAGELEGWLTGVPRRCLVANEGTAAVWKPLLETPETPVEVVAPLPGAQCAALTARRAAADSRPSLVPPEFTARYRQQFVDRIWMRVLGAAIVLYLLVVVAYVGLLKFTEMGVTKVEADARNLQGAYTNALKLRDQVRVMEDQLNLQFASLQCYRAVAEKLPESLTLDSMSFQRGRKFIVYGSGEVSAQQTVNDFNDLLRKYTVEGEPLFSKVNVPNISVKPGTQTLTWNFECELKRGEGE